MISQKLLANRLIKLGEDIRDGKCGLDEEEMVLLMTLITHRKITLEQACQEKGISRATLYRKIQSGEYPLPHKDSGGKEYYWLDELP